jgi:hypothetical protein
VDFGAPRRARDQRRKIIAIEAHAIAWRRYRINAGGLNARLLGDGPPGWTAIEMIDELLGRPRRIVAFDFPFCVPDVLLRDEQFAAAAGYRHGAFGGWRAFNAFVADRLPLLDPLDKTEASRAMIPGSQAGCPRARCRDETLQAATRGVTTIREGRVDSWPRELPRDATRGGADAPACRRGGAGKPPVDRAGT